MTQNGPSGRCRTCDFRRVIGGVSYCVRNAPAPAPATGEALWPRVEPTDYCGQFCCEAAQVREASFVKREAQDLVNTSSPADAGPASSNSKSSIVDSRSPSASAANLKSQISNFKCEAGPPVFADEYGPYCRIPLTQNRYAKVDPADYLWLSQFRWCCKANRDTCYAIRHIQERGRTKRIHMHRQIMNTPDNMICDHKNHNGLDNRRLNLRNCTTEQNNANRRSSPHATSEFIGVSYCRKRKKWVSSIKHHGRSKNLGQFDRPEDAARAHDKAAWAIWGEFANLNFPDEYPAGGP